MTEHFDPRADDQRDVTQQWIAKRQLLIRAAHAERDRLICAAIVAAVTAFRTGWRRLFGRPPVRMSPRALDHQNQRNDVVAAKSEHRGPAQRIGCEYSSTP
jgi:hypothetical protein